MGEIPYRSTVTDRVERLPIAVSVLGAPGTFLDSRDQSMEMLTWSTSGTDIILADVVERAMKAAGLATEVRTGPQMYLVDDEMS